MNRALQILLVAGILVNLIKGGELLLRPYQQKWLQDKCDTLALRLDYTKPLEWYLKFNQFKTQFLLTTISVFVYGYFFIYSWLWLC
jgi:hypothetical protein